MSDPAPQTTPDAPKLPETPSQALPLPDYSFLFAAKKFGYALTFWETAQKMGVTVAPVATQVIEKISSITAKYGITIHIDQPVFEGALPIFIFAFLLLGHDYAKVRTQSKWL